MVVVTSPFVEPAEGVIFQTASTKLIVNEHALGTANLYITEDNVIWGGGINESGDALPTIAILYPTISLHAIQREPLPAVYMVINYDLKLPGASPPDDLSDIDDDYDDIDLILDLDHQPITQLRFVPQNESELNLIFSALCQGQALHPDHQPAHSIMGDLLDLMVQDDDDDDFEDAVESDSSSDEQASRLHQLRLENSNGQHYEDYEDAESSE